MRIRVTGGTGFIGSRYVRTLLRRGFAESAPVQVTVLDKLTCAGNRGDLEPVEGGPAERTQALLNGCGAGWKRVRPMAGRKGHDRRYSLDDSLLRGLGYRPRTSFADGLAATIRWYQENRPWWEPLKRAAGERSSVVDESTG